MKTPSPSKLVSILMLLVAGIWEDLRALWREVLNPWDALDRELRENERREWPT